MPTMSQAVAGELALTPAGPAKVAARTGFLKAAVRFLLTGNVRQAVGER